MMNAGIVIMLMALALFMSTLFGNSYMLTSRSLYLSVNNHEHLSNIEPAVSWMKNMTILLQSQ